MKIAKVLSIALLLGACVVGVSEAKTAVKAAAKAPAKWSREQACTAIKGTLVRVKDAGEKERWGINLDLWKLVVAKQGDLKAVDYEAFKTTLPNLTGSVANLPENDEKERWEADEALWSFVGDSQGDLSKVDPAQLDKWFGKMKEQLPKIKDAGEKTRWTSNVALWKSVLPEPAPAAK
jgi:hypothetical protein